MRIVVASALLALLGGCAGNQQVSSAPEIDKVLVNGEELTPIHNVFPDYPKAAATSGLSGNCVVEFTVTEEGTTKDHSIFWCSSRSFESPSITAAEELVYSPVLIGGKPAEIPNVKYVFSYDLKR